MENNLSEKIENFLISNDRLVLATTDGEKGFAAMLYYIYHMDSTIYCISKVGTQKVQNIIDHPDVSIVVPSKDSYSALQCWAVAKIVNGMDVDQNITERLLEIATSTDYPWAILDMMEAKDNEKKLIEIKLSKVRFFDEKTLNESDHITESEL